MDSETTHGVDATTLHAKSLFVRGDSGRIASQQHERHSFDSIEVEPSPSEMPQSKPAGYGPPPAQPLPSTIPPPPPSASTSSSAAAQPATGSMKSAVPRPPPRPPPGTAPPRPDRPAPLLPQASAASTTVAVTGALQLKPKMPERPENAVWNPCGFQPVYGDIAQNSSSDSNNAQGGCSLPFVTSEPVAFGPLASELVAPEPEIVDPVAQQPESQPQHSLHPRESEDYCSNFDHPPSFPQQPWPEVPPLPGSGTSMQAESESGCIGEAAGSQAQNLSGEGSAEVEAVPATATSAPRATQQDVTSSVPDSPRAGKETVFPSMPCTPPRHPRLANPISSPSSAAKSPPTASMTTENMKLDTTKPYHKWSTDELKEYARRRRLPQIEEMSRGDLMANHRIVDGWDGKKTFTELEALAKVQGCPVRPGSTRESLMTDLMNHTFGGLKEKPPVAASSEPAGTTSATRHPAAAADRAKSDPPPHSAERSDDTLAAEVRRILNAKDNREVLGVAFGERLTLQEARSRYKKLALQLHSDKRTDIGIAKAGGLQACENAWTRLTQAREWADRTLKEGATTRTSVTGARVDHGRPQTGWTWTPSSSRAPAAPAPPSHPPPSAAPPPPAGMSVARPPEPEGTKAPRPFGWGSLDPLPPPHPNFGALRVVVVD